MRFFMALTLLISVLAANPAFAAGDPNGFKSLQEFVEALDEMPANAFQAQAAHTSMDDLKKWRKVLLEVSPVSYEAWNSKLRLLPGIGFTRDTTGWLLTPEAAQQTIGFHPQSRAGRYESLVDLYRSFQNDSAELIVSRMMETDETVFFEWLQIVDRVNPVLHDLTKERASQVRRIGYTANEYWLPEVPHVPVTGFASPIVDERLKIRTYAELESFVVDTDIADVEQAKHVERRFQASGPDVLVPMLGKLRSTNPEAYRKLIRLSQFRVSIGFRTAAHPVPELLSQRLPVVQIAGFFPESDCDKAMDPETANGI